MVMMRPCLLRSCAPVCSSASQHRPSAANRNSSPSVNLSTNWEGMPFRASASCVQWVASNSHPAIHSMRATSTAESLSASVTDRNTRPPRGSRIPAASCDLSNAKGKLGPTPMTSPVDFISGPNVVSTPGKRGKGSTASLTATWATSRSRGPVALLTKGTVRLPRGLTSNTYSRAPSDACCRANWIFIRPTTPNSRASAAVCCSICSCTEPPSVTVGMTHAESPECTPASSTCCMMAPMYTSSPSQTASTSISTDRSKKRSINTGWRGEAFTAVCMYRFRPSRSYTISMARPPRTYEGRTNTGKPIRSAISSASLSLRAVPYGGACRPNRSSTSPNR
ncbi:MAG: hypothetical protein BWY79_01015 [Actinobacteria bacterium ADurb.Bin444]|nr:MAG: hypothetical protein BWY79_01015 [Actinobacteria bacterium ADurb.Bin444]